MSRSQQGAHELTLSAQQIAEALGIHAPTVEQCAVIEHPLEPLLVIAGAGSGKTETMATRVVSLIANGHVKPAGVLGLTFTRKAAAELSERVRRRLSALRQTAQFSHDEDELGLDRPTIMTYNAYAASLVSDHALRIGVEPASSLLSEAGQWQIAFEVVAGWQDDLGLDRSAESVTEAVLTLAGQCAEHLVTPERVHTYLTELLERIAASPRAPKQRTRGFPRDVMDLAASANGTRTIVALVEQYLAIKRQREVIDFGDQVTLAAEVARDDDVRQIERDRFRVVLLDEYQDTSHAQLVLLSRLFGDGHPVTAVGDPHQSIYGWRGASAGGLQRFPEHFPPATVLDLSTSWRNDTAILNAANETARALRAQQGQAASQVSVPLLSARPGAASGGVQCGFFSTEDDEARALAEFVADTRDAAHAHVPSVAVLCRRRAQFPRIEAALRARGLPVEVVGLGGLLDTPEVADILAVLRVVHDPGRGDALMRLLTGAWVNLGARDIRALADWANELDRDPVQAPGERHSAMPREERDSSLIDAVDHLPDPLWSSAHQRHLSGSGFVRLEHLQRVLRYLRSRVGQSLADLVVDTERAIGLDIELAARPHCDPAWARRHLDSFRDVAASYTAGAVRPTLGGFLAWVDAAHARENGLDSADSLGVEESSAAVQLMTIHAAKGLEWDVVALPGMNEGQFPSHSARCGVAGAPPRVTDRGWLSGIGKLPYDLRGDRLSLPELRVSNEDDQVELRDRIVQFYEDMGEHRLLEERRLAYVAVTRARHTLWMSGSWWCEFASRPRPPSRFLTELADSGIAEVTSAAEPPQESEVNPMLEVVREATWPADYLGSRRAALTAGAALVRESAIPESIEEMRVASTHDPVAMRWLRDAELLLREREEAVDSDVIVELPRHLSASALVALASDPAGFAQQVRRPVPVEPNTLARRGSRFHQWVEEYFGTAALLDVDDLFSEDSDDELDDSELAGIKQWFLSSDWARREVLAIEEPVETPLGGRTIRSRIDAVFVADDPRFDVEIIDWKTGHQPATNDGRQRRDVQLAVYRLAWSRRYGVPIDRISASFVYVRGGTQVTPVDLLSEEELVALVERATRT